MVCEKCEKKLSKGVVPDVWKDGARNVMGGRDGGRITAKNTILETKSKSSARFTPHLKTCRICKSKLPQDGLYCIACAFSKGICAMCGVKVADLTFDKRGGVEWGRRKKRDPQEEQEFLEEKLERRRKEKAEREAFIKAVEEGALPKQKKQKVDSEKQTSEEPSTTVATAAETPTVTDSNHTDSVSSQEQGSKPVSIVEMALDTIARRTSEMSKATVADVKKPNKPQPIAATPAPGLATAAIPPPPKAWQTATDAGTGKEYYYNSLTGATQWDMPDELKEEDDWLKAIDAASGKQYLYHRVTGETKWA